jgi:hypothetical protein
VAAKLKKEGGKKEGKEGKEEKREGERTRESAMHLNAINSALKEEGDVSKLRCLAGGNSTRRKHVQRRVKQRKTPMSKATPINPSCLAARNSPGYNSYISTTLTIHLGHTTAKACSFSNLHASPLGRPSPK